MADETKNTEIDDWLDDLEGPEEEGSDELDQSDIDALLGGGDDEAPAEAAAEEEAPAEAAAESAEEASDELEQTDIDALLGGGDDSAPAEAAAEEEAPAEAAAEPAEEASDELEQTDIDALLGGSEEPSEEKADEMELDQDDMDQLFAEEEEETPFSSKEVDFAEILDDEEEGGESFDLGEETEFDVDTFDMDVDAEDETVVDTSFAEMTGADEKEHPAEKDGEKKKGFVLPIPVIQDIVQNKSFRIGGLIALVLLLALGGYMFLKPGEKVPAIVMEDTAEQQDTSGEAPTPQPQETIQVANTLPMVLGDTYQMTKDGGELSIHLVGRDEDNDPLEYEVITSPKHGRLSGKAPDLTYLPNKNFPGTDMFEFRSNDGKGFSEPAAIHITGPNLSGKVVEKVAQAKPKPKPRPKPKVYAKDVILDAVSTSEVAINWKNIWRKANKASFNSKITIEIVGKDLQGELIKTGSASHLYKPDKFLGGDETLSYRFKYAGVTSKTKKLTLRIKLGNPAPEIHLASLEKGYYVGETVVIDASPTKDDARESVEFAWEQIQGVPVQIEAANPEGSAISFVMPSSFYVSRDPGPVFRISAIDHTGKKDVYDLKVPTVSRRQTALWRGTPPGNEIAREPSCPQGRCAGALLPWPYLN